MHHLPASRHSLGVRLAVLLCMICAPYHLATAGAISGCVPYWFPTTSPSANISTGTCSGSFDITKPTVVYGVTMTTPTTVKIDANAYSAALRYQGSSQYGLWHAIIDGGTFSPGLTVDLRNGARLLIRNVKVINGANPIILSVASGSTLVIANSTIDDSVVLTCKEWSTCIFVGNSITTAAWDGQLLIFWQVTTRSQAILMHNYLACAGGAACEIQWGWDVSSNSHVLLRENVLQAHTVPYSFLATASVVASYYDAWEGPVDYGAKTIASCVRTNAKVPYPLGFCSPNCAAGFHCDVRRAGVTSSTDGTQCACNCIDTLDALAGRPGSAPQFCTMPTEVDDYICGTLVGKHPGGQPMPHTPTVPLSRSASYATSPTGTLTHTTTITPPRTPTRSATLTTPPTRTRTRTRTVTGTTSTTLPKADNRTHAPTVQRAPTSTPPPTPAPPATPVPSSAAGNDTAPPPEATVAPSNSSESSATPTTTITPPPTATRSRREAPMLTCSPASVSLSVLTESTVYPAVQFVIEIATGPSASFNNRTMEVRCDSVINVTRPDVSTNFDTVKAALLKEEPLHYVNNTHAILWFGSHPAYTILTTRAGETARDEIRCSFTHASFSGPPIPPEVPEASFRFAVNVPPPPPPPALILEDLKTGTLTATATATTIGALAGASPSAAQAARSRALIDLAACAFEYDEALNPIVYPFGFAIGSSKVRYYIGAMLMNPLLLAACYALHVCLAVIVGAIPRVRAMLVSAVMGPEAVGGAPELDASGVRAVVRGAVRSPSLSVVLLLFFWQDTVSVTTTVMLRGEEIGWQIFAGMVLVLWFIIPVAAFGLLVVMPAYDLIALVDGPLRIRDVASYVRSKPRPRFPSVYRVHQEGIGLLRCALLGRGEWDDGVGVDDEFPGYMPLPTASSSDASHSPSWTGLSTASSPRTKATTGCTIRDGVPMSYEKQRRTSGGCGTSGTIVDGTDGLEATLLPSDEPAPEETLHGTIQATPETALRNYEFCFTNRYDALFTAYKPTRRWFMVVELTVVYATGIVNGVQPEDSQCDAVSIGLLVVMGLYFAMVLLLLPYHTLLEQSFGVLIALAQVTGAVVLVFELSPTTAANVGIAAMLLASLKSAIDVLFLLYDLTPLRRMCEDDNDKGVEKNNGDVAQSHSNGATKALLHLPALSDASPVARLGESVLRTLPPSRDREQGKDRRTPSRAAMPVRRAWAAADGAVPSASAMLMASSPLQQPPTDYTAVHVAARALAQLPQLHAKASSPEHRVDSRPGQEAPSNPLRFAPPVHSPAERGLDVYGFRHK
jgi:hypothetical protein